MDVGVVEKWGTWKAGGSGWGRGFHCGTGYAAGRRWRCCGKCGEMGTGLMVGARERNAGGGCARFQEMRGRVLENGGNGGKLQGMELGGISSYTEATVTATECK
jgi:hypothetical protein